MLPAAVVVAAAVAIIAAGTFAVLLLVVVAGIGSVAAAAAARTEIAVGPDAAGTLHSVGAAAAADTAFDFVVGEIVDH